MEENKDSNRKKNKRADDDDYQRERKSKRARSRSRSPADKPEKESRRKRRHSRSRSPEKRSKDDRPRNDDPKPDEIKKEAPERKRKETDMLNTRTGGAYIPPARLKMMQAQITDKTSMAYQRLAWEALKKSIHGHINKINVGNIGIIIKELLKDNIVRGRGLLCRSVIQAQAASPTFTNVYAALVAAINSRFPNIGELLLKRLVIQFKRGFKRNDKPICISSASFIAHLVNQRVAHEILALELLTLLVETPTDDSIEVAIAFLKECGQKLTEVSSKGVNAIFEMLRNILHEGQLDKRVQYMIEVMFQVWKDGFKDHPALMEELELVPEEEQFTHLLMLDDATDPQDILNVFKLDDKFEENEQKYKTLSKEILGSDAESGEEDGSGESGSEESDEEEAPTEEQKMTIIDNTETNLVALRRTIYLTINSSLDFEECAHKLMKMQLKPGQEVELCHMFLDCCAEQRTYEKFYGLLAQRFCNINRIYIGPFQEIFKDSYSTAHRLDTNRLRNVSKFFAHLLFTDSIGWEVLECVKLNEEDTTSSSRIYIKILFQELAEYMGLKKLNDRLKDPTLQEAFRGVFPRDNPKNTRFSINFFTSIGLGGLTDELREHLKQMPKNVPPPVTEIKLDSDSSSDSESSSSSSSSSDSSSGSSSSSSDENEEKEKTKKKKKNKDKDKSPAKENAPEKDTERWGHDGFYDTYGKDARRMESRPDRPRDKRDDRRNRDDGNGDFRRRDDREGRNDRRDREERNEDRRDRDRNNRDEARRRDDRNDDRRDDRRREEPRNDNDRRDREERNEDRRDRDRNNRDEARRPDDRNDDRRDDRRREDPRNDDDRRNREDRSNRRDDNSKRRDDDRNDRHGDRRDDRRRDDREDTRRDDREENARKRDYDRNDEKRDDRERRRDAKDDSKKEDRRKDEKYSQKRDDEKRSRIEKYDEIRRDRDSDDESRREQNTKSNKKNKNKDEEESRSKRKDKEERSEKKKNKERRKKQSDSDSSDEDRSRKRKDKKNKPDDDGWDIEAKHTPPQEDQVLRYWDKMSVRA